MPATSKIIIGTVQFGLPYGINNKVGKPNKEQVKEILDLAFLNGINMLDSAEAYGDAHEVIGNYHHTANHHFQIITKYSSKRNDLSESITKRIEEDLNAMQVKQLYGYMFHSFGDFKTHFNEYKSELIELKEKGKIKKIGVSVYTNQEIEQLLEHKEIDLIQLPFNLLDNLHLRSNAINKAKECGVEIHTRSAFLQGLFFMDQNKLPQKLTPLKKYLTEIHQLTHETGYSMSDVALNYVTSQKNIDRVLIGVETVEQLKNNISSLQKQIPKSLIDQINSINVKETELLNPAFWNN